MEIGFVAVGVAVLVLSLIIASIRKTSMSKGARTKASERAPKPEVFPNALKFGKYLSGHPGITQQQEIKAVSEEDHLVILTGGFVNQRLASIRYTDITDVEMEDQSTMERRVTATRLLTVGIFAFAAKKKEVHHCFYVIITWKDGQFCNETIIEFTGKTALQDATVAQNLLRQEVNKANTK